LRLARCSCWCSSCATCRICGGDIVAHGLGCASDFQPFVSSRDQKDISRRRPTCKALSSSESMLGLMMYCTSCCRINPGRISIRSNASITVSERSTGVDATSLENLTNPPRSPRSNRPHRDLPRIFEPSSAASRPSLHPRSTAPGFGAGKSLMVAFGKWEIVSACERWGLRCRRLRPSSAGF